MIGHDTKSALRRTLEQMAAVQRANAEISDLRGQGWRQAIVDQRRVLSMHLQALTDLVRTAAADDGIDPVRSALSSLRAALAEHQASWPAVSLDPEAPIYRHSIERVRACFGALQAAVEALDARPQNAPRF